LRSARNESAGSGPDCSQLLDDAVARTRLDHLFVLRHVVLWSDDEERPVGPGSLVVVE